MEEEKLSVHYLCRPLFLIHIHLGPPAATTALSKRQLPSLVVLARPVDPRHCHYVTGSEGFQHQQELAL